MKDAMKLVLNFLIFLGLLALTLCLLASCGPNYHLRKSKKHLNKAIELGAKIESDTIYDTLRLITKEVQFDTILQQVDFNDTITVVKDRIVTKVKVNVKDRIVYIDSKFKSDYILR